MCYGRENIVGTGHPQTEIANNYIIYAATMFCGTTLPSSGFVGVFEKQWAFLEEEWQDYKQNFPPTLHGIVMYILFHTMAASELQVIAHSCGLV